MFILRPGLVDRATEPTSTGNTTNMMPMYARCIHSLMAPTWPGVCIFRYRRLGYFSIASESDISSMSWSSRHRGAARSSRRRRSWTGTLSRMQIDFLSAWRECVGGRAILPAVYKGIFVHVGRHSTRRGRGAPSSGVQSRPSVTCSSATGTRPYPLVSTAAALAVRNGTRGLLEGKPPFSFNPEELPSHYLFIGSNRSTKYF